MTDDFQYRHERNADNKTDRIEALKAHRRHRMTQRCGSLNDREERTDHHTNDSIPRRNWERFKSLLHPFGNERRTDDNTHNQND